MCMNYFQILEVYTHTSLNLYSQWCRMHQGTATLALAVVDFGPAYLLGLLTLAWEGPGYEALSQDARLFYNYALVPERDVNVNI